jgi:hypothetical protein
MAKQSHTDADGVKQFSNKTKDNRLVCPACGSDGTDRVDIDFGQDYLTETRLCTKMSCNTEYKMTFDKLVVGSITTSNE